MSRVWRGAAPKLKRMSDLAAFLHEQRTGLLDSTGAFTIAVDKALAKLAHSQLPDPSFWVLKVAQFASLAETNTVEFQIEARVTRVAIELPSPVRLETLQRGLASVDALPDRGLDHLVTALRAVGGVVGRKFALRLLEPGQTEILLFDGDRVTTERQQTALSVTGLILEVTTVTPGALGALVDTLGLHRRAGEGLCLANRAFTAPVQVKLDGRILERPEPEKPRCFTQHLLWDFSSSEVGMRPPVFLPAAAGARVSAFWELAFNFTLAHTPMRLTPDPVDYAAPSTLYWLRDGVVVGEEPLKGRENAFALSLHVDATDCEADLGGLNIRHSDQFVAKKRWVQELLAQLDKKVQADILKLVNLQGPVLGGLKGLLAVASHMPFGSRLDYRKPSFIANSFTRHPSFRKKLLQHVQRRAGNRQIDLRDLKPASAPTRPPML